MSTKQDKTSLHYKLESVLVSLFLIVFIKTKKIKKIYLNTGTVCVLFTIATHLGIF